ncbi:hypothetical protein N7490_002692 [Penicillium lividum]|nr:hypothetical protein N7490_002692 [Penicillium lividum]
MPEPQSEPLGQIHSIRRSVTFPTKLIPQSTRGSGAPNPNVAENVIFYHPSAKIVHFAPRALAPIPSSSAPTDFDYPVDTIETHPWRSATERTVATAPLRLEKVHGLTVFLKCGNVVHAILKNSQCWCVDGVSKFVLRIRPLTYYRIEIPHETQEDKGLVEDLKVALPTVLRYEVTPCPFKREFTVELPEEAMAPRRKKAWRPKVRNDNVTASYGSEQGYPGDIKPEWLDSASTGDDTDGAATDDSAVIPERSDSITSESLLAHETSHPLSLSDTPQPRVTRRSFTETPQTFSSLRAKFDVPTVPEEQHNSEPVPEEPLVESEPFTVIVAESGPVDNKTKESLIEPEPVPVPEFESESEPTLAQPAPIQPRSTEPLGPLHIKLESPVPPQENDGPAEVITYTDPPAEADKEAVQTSPFCADCDSTKIERNFVSNIVVATESRIELPENVSGETKHDDLEPITTKDKSSEPSKANTSSELESKGDEVADLIPIEAEPTEPQVGESETAESSQDHALAYLQISKGEPVDEIVTAEHENDPNHSFSSTPESFHSAEPHSPSDSISTHATSLGSPSTVQKYRMDRDQDSSSLYQTPSSLPSDIPTTSPVLEADMSLKDKPSKIDKYQMTREDPPQPSLNIPSNSKQSTAKSSSPSDLSHMSTEFRRRAQATRERDVSPMPASSALYQPTPGEEAASLISKALALVLVPPIHLFIVLLHIAARIVINPSAGSSRAEFSRSQPTSKATVPEDDFSFPLQREPSSDYEDAQMTKKLDPWDLD